MGSPSPAQAEPVKFQAGRTRFRPAFDKFSKELDAFRLELGKFQRARRKFQAELGATRLGKRPNLTAKHAKKPMFQPFLCKAPSPLRSAGTLHIYCGANGGTGGCVGAAGANKTASSGTVDSACQPAMPSRQASVARFIESLIAF
jgi:hypothetical protein